MFVIIWILLVLLLQIILNVSSCNKSQSRQANRQRLKEEKDWVDEGKSC